MSLELKLEFFLNKILPLKTKQNYPRSLFNKTILYIGLDMNAHESFFIKADGTLKII